VHGGFVVLARIAEMTRNDHQKVYAADLCEVLAYLYPIIPHNLPGKQGGIYVSNI
jgi:hypothetical protein